MGPSAAVATVRTAVRTALAALAPSDRGRPLLVAVSGGADSLALAAAVAFEARRAAHPVAAATIDHGLQDGSSDRALQTARLLFEIGFDPVHVEAVDVGSAGGPEAAARRARYEALDQLADTTDPPALIVLGHTRDDQAETVLLGLGRGSGPRSLAGMRSRSGRYLRPLLDVDRATTHAACAELGLPVWSDPHNVDPRYRRVRVRREALPLLEDVLGGGVAAALARTAALMQDDVDALDALALDALAECRCPDGDLDTARLGTHPRAIRTRAVRAWVSEAGGGALLAWHLRGIDDLVMAGRGRASRGAEGVVVRGGAALDVPGGFVVSYRSGRLHLQSVSG